MGGRSALLASLPALLFVACSSDPEPGGSSGSSGGTSSGAPGDGGDGGATNDGASQDSATTGDAAGDADAAPVGQLFAFVGSSDGKIRSYKVDSALGTWTLAMESTAGTNPSFLAFDPGRRRVVAVDSAGGGLVRSFAFDPGTGGVTQINTKPAGGAGSTHLSFDPTGKWVMVANYTGGNMSIFPIDAAGTLGDAADAKASGAMSHWAGTNPSGTHVFVSALGANVVAQYTLAAGTGALTDNGTAALPVGAGPRHLRVSCDREVGVRDQRARDHRHDVRLRQGDGKAHREADDLGATRGARHGRRVGRGDLRAPVG